MKHILGVDIAKDKFDCCLLCGEQQFHKEFNNSPRGFKQLMGWLAKAGVAPATLWACMEATGIYGEALLAFLFQAGVAVSKVNPAQIKHYARSLLARHKTDRQDALLIAQFARERSARGQLRLWSPPSPEQARLRSLTRLLAARKQQLASESRRAKMVDGCLAAHIRSMVRSFNKHIAQIEKEIEELIAASPELQRKRELLLSIPCVGPVTAHTVLAELPAEIQSARAAAAYAGLTPQREDSGQKIGRARLSKTGNAHLRQAFYMPAVNGKNNARLKALAERLEQKGKARKQAIGACMHLLLRICFGVLASGQPFQADWKRARIGPTKAS
jgi:transposase